VQLTDNPEVSCFDANYYGRVNIVAIRRINSDTGFLPYLGSGNNVVMGEFLMQSKEQTVQKFSYRCPYCNQPISYDQITLKEGENAIVCPSCQKTYIKVVREPFGEESE